MPPFHNVRDLTPIWIETESTPPQKGSSATCFSVNCSAPNSYPHPHGRGTVDYSFRVKGTLDSAKLSLISIRARRHITEQNPWSFSHLRSPLRELFSPRSGVQTRRLNADAEIPFNRPWMRAGAKRSKNIDALLLARHPSFDNPSQGLFPLHGPRGGLT